MADAFGELIDRANAFHAELRENNTRDWFEPRKDTYRDQIKKPAELLGNVVADELRRLTGKSFKTKLFRVHRDVRFSKDKTPYNTHLHLLWGQGAEMAPSWFLGASPEYLRLLVGIPGLRGDGLSKLRAFIDAEGEELTAAIAASNGALSDFGADPLKRVPKPYAPDHPHGDLLRRKSLVVGADFPDGWREPGLIPTLKAMAKDLLPVWTCLDQGLT